MWSAPLALQQLLAGAFKALHLGLAGHPGLSLLCSLQGVSELPTLAFNPLGFSMWALQRTRRPCIKGCTVGSLVWPRNQLWKSQLVSEPSITAATLPLPHPSPLPVALFLHHLMPCLWAPFAGGSPLHCGCLQSLKSLSDHVLRGPVPISFLPVSSFPAPTSSSPCFIPNQEILKEQHSCLSNQTHYCSCFLVC